MESEQRLAVATLVIACSARAAGPGTKPTNDVVCVTGVASAVAALLLAHASTEPAAQWLSVSAGSESAPEGAPLPKTLPQSALGRAQWMRWRKLKKWLGRREDCAPR